nr:hypothetical protein GTC16762_20420 [Pigmentibacter ruber]
MFSNSIKYFLTFFCFLSNLSYGVENTKKGISLNLDEHKEISDDNEIIYVVEDNDGNKSAKIAKINGKPTLGGVNEEPLLLSTYKIEIPDIKKNNPTIVLDTSSHQDLGCYEIVFSIDSSNAYISQLPNFLNTANSCSFNVLMNGKFYKKINLLINYSFKKWCNLNTNLEATRTARKISENCEIDLNTKEINLTKQNITDISPISGFVALKYLYLNENQISYLPINIFKNLNKLFGLTLHSNRLTKVDYNDFKGLKNLKYLNLGYNKLNSLPENLLEDLISLKYFSINENKEIDSLPENLFKNNLFLEELVLSINKIRIIPRNIFKNLKNIKEIDLHFNNIEFLESDIFSENGKLKNLNLSINKFSKFPEDLFFPLKNLRNLNFSSNYFPEIPIDLFKNNKKLEKLIIYQNGSNELSINPKLFVKEIESLKHFSPYNSTENQIDRYK